ncbi:MAG: ATP-binding protein [Gloeomargarita sp. HHBFW_bins_205]
MGWQRLWQGWSALPPFHRGWVIIALPVLSLVTAVGGLAWVNFSLRDYERWVVASQRVHLEGRDLLNHLLDAETAVRGYLLTRRPGFLEPYHTAVQQWPLTLENLDILVSDNPPQARRVQDLHRAVAQTFALLERTLITAGGQGSLEATKQQMDRTRALLNGFLLEQATLVQQRQQQLEQRQQWSHWLGLGAIIVGFTSGGLALSLFRQLYRELQTRESQLATANQQLQAACERLSRFTAQASHELRAPLAAILSHAQVGVMLGQQSPDQALARLEKVATLAKDMGQLVGDLLFLARHENAATLTRTTRVEMGHLLQQVNQTWQATQGSSHHLTLATPEQPLYVWGDPDLLRQVVMNLLSNAYRYTPVGGHIRLALQRQDQQAVLTVADDGMGISPEALPHIFEYFYRDERVRQRGISGSGLGLAIVRQIVELHGGTITVDSQINQGTTFTVRLPVAS